MPKLFVDGRPVEVEGGFPLSTALARAGFRTLRHSPRVNAPRGAFCLMGVCQECTIIVDGGLVQACMVRPRDGMQIELKGAGEA